MHVVQSSRRYQPMVLVVAAFAIGILADRSWNLLFLISAGASCLGLMGWVLSSLSQGGRAGRVRIGSMLLLIASAGLGSAWHHAYWHWYGQHTLVRFAGDQASACCVEAVVLSEPQPAAPEVSPFESDETSVRTRYSILARSIRDGTRWRPASGRAELVVHDSIEHVSVGDRVRIHGRLVAAGDPTNPGQFNFRDHFRRQRTLAFVHVYHEEGVEVLPGKSLVPGSLVSHARHQLNQLLWANLDAAQAGFAAAIMLGNREQLSRARRDRFVETGTVHVLAISGLHIGILAGFLLLLLRFPGSNRRICLLLTIGFVLMYAALVEFRPPATRAAILIALWCLGRLMGEAGFSINLLAVAAGLVLLINPTDLFSIGPQLSFLAVITLTIGSHWIFWPPQQDPIKRLIAGSRSTPIRWACWWGRQGRTAILVSGVIWLVTLPIVANQFHLVAPVSLLINPVLVVPLAWALYAGLAVWLFAPVIPWIGSGFGWLCGTSLMLIEWSIGAVHQIPGGHVWTSGPRGWSVSLFYMTALLALTWRGEPLKFRWLLVGAWAWWFGTWWLPDRIERGFTPSDRLTCTFLDVGHGTCILIQQPDGQNWLYDAGSLGAADFAARNIATALWFERISHIDKIVISHADVDHFNALPRLIQQFSVGEVCVNEAMLESHSPAVFQLLAEVRRTGTAVRSLHQGDCLDLGPETSFRVLGPVPGGFGENDNADSLVVLISHAGQRVLLPGDLEGAGLKALLTQPPLACDLVMAPHHGSKLSRPEALVGWCQPRVVVISGGQRSNSDLEPMFRVGDPGRRIYRTDRDGAIQVQLRRNEYSIRRWDVDRWRQDFR